MLFLQGNLYATKDLDYEDKNAYLLTVEAKDNPIDPQETRYNVTQVMFEQLLLLLKLFVIKRLTAMVLILFSWDCY